MTELQELASALVAFQASAPIIHKGRTALIPTKSGGSYQYKYADLSDIWEAIREPLKTNGLAVTQSLTGGASGFMGIKTTVWHTSGQVFADTVEIPTGSSRTAQEVGSQVTYFKRYALSALLGLSTEEDDDGAAASRTRTEPPQRTEMDDALEELDDAVAALKLHAGDVAGKFYTKHKKPPRHTDAATVRSFIRELHDEVEKAS